MAERLTGYLAGAATVNMVVLADSLRDVSLNKVSLFEYMAEQPAQTPHQIADGMGLSERWIREVLNQLVRACLSYLRQALQVSRAHRCFA
jgi:hypothetical protein